MEFVSAKEEELGKTKAELVSASAVSVQGKFKEKGKNWEKPKQNQLLHLQPLFSENSMKKDRLTTKIQGKKGEICHSS